MDLREFLALPHLFGWGGVVGDDCTTWCASWVRERMGVDPAAALRGTYTNEFGAHRVIYLAGGLVALIGDRLSPLGFTRTDTPADGDICVVRAASFDGNTVSEISAIKFGPLWAMLSPGRVVAKKADLVAAWRFPE
jgi:hypothetical protein